MIDFNYLSPYIRVAMDGIIDPPWYLRERVIFDYELLYIKEGEVLITIEEEVFFAKPGDIFLFKPGKRHSMKIIGKSRFRQPHIHFDLFYQADSPEVRVSFKPIEYMSEEEKVLFREDATTDSYMKLPDKICLKNTKYFEEMLFDIIKEFDMKMPFYEINLKGLFIKLWTYLLRESYWNGNPTVFSNISELTRIKEYLDHHTDREVPLDELAGTFNFSKYYLTRLFGKAFAVTPIHYHKLIRIEKAKEMIQFTDIPLTKVAETFGFGSINAFSRTFRNVEGVPPSFYRRKN